MAAKTGMRLWTVTVTEPRYKGDRKRWRHEYLAVATSARGAEFAVRQEHPSAFQYNGTDVDVEEFEARTLKHLEYKVDR